MVTMVDNKAFMVADHKVIVMATAVVVEMVAMVMVMVMLVVVLVFAETIKNVVGSATAFIPNVGMACPGRNNRPSWKHAIVHTVPTMPM